MFTYSYLSTLETQSDISSWMGFTFLGGLLGLFTGIALTLPFTYVMSFICGYTVKILSKILPNLLLDDELISALLMFSTVIQAPIFGVGIGVSVFQGMLISKIGVAEAIPWIFYNGLIHFIATLLYSILSAGVILVSTGRNFDLQGRISPALEKNIQRARATWVFAIWGILIGLLQWFLIREYFSNSILWLIASALLFPFSIFIPWFFIRDGISRLGVVIISLPTLLLYGFMTGKLLDIMLKANSN